MGGFGNVYQRGAGQVGWVTYHHGGSVGRDEQFSSCDTGWLPEGFFGGVRAVEVLMPGGRPPGRFKGITCSRLRHQAAGNGREVIE